MGNHRAARSDRSSLPASSTSPRTSAAAPSGGKRRAEKPRRALRPQFTGLSALGGLNRLPALPTLVGATAVAVAGIGAVGVSGSLPDTHSLRLSAGANAIGGTDAYSFAAGSPRARAISRDSQRQALQDAADQRLKAEAEAQNRQRNAALTSLAKSAESRAAQIEKNQWQLPTSGYHLTARFGMGGGLWSHNHTGLDFAAPIGTPIVSVANGVVTETGYAGAYGNRTIITLTDGTEIWYCHQSAIDVSVGESVIGGQHIGNVGNTGNTTGPHLHLEVRPGGGDPVDPYTALVYHGVTP